MENPAPFCYGSKDFPIRCAAQRTFPLAAGLFRIRWLKSEAHTIVEAFFPIYSGRKFSALFRNATVNDVT